MIKNQLSLKKIGNGEIERNSNNDIRHIRSKEKLQD